MDFKTLITNEYSKNPKLKELSQSEQSRYFYENFSEYFTSVEGARYHVRQYYANHKVERSPVKILLFDIETAPMIAATFKKWDTSIGDDFILRDWNIISWSAKWLFEKEVFSMRVTAKEQEQANDERIVRGLWKVLDEANIVIAHNLKKFDKKIAQTRFLKYDLKFPSHYQEIDTLQELRKHFKITSNKLDYVAKKFLGIGSKKPTDSSLWMDCIGNPYHGIKPSEKAIKDMSLYCDQDVRVLEDVYLAIRGYITKHPNLALWSGTDNMVCKSCYHDEFHPIGHYTTLVNTYFGYRCKKCGNVHRSRRPIENSKVALR